MLSSRAPRICQIVAEVQTTHVWANDGPYAELYGLEPNFGCCTANFNQGWPKYANMIFFTTQDGGVAIGAIAPASAALPDGRGVLSLETDYPFSDVVTVTLVAGAGASAQPVYVRIPGWAVGTTATLNGAAAPAPSNGSMYRILAPGGGATTTLVVTFAPALRTETWYESAVSVYRGSLMYSLPLDLDFTALAQYGFESYDYQVTSASEWRYALEVNPADPAATMTFVSRGLAPGAAPFNHSGWPSFLKATARPLPSWGLEAGSAAAPPASPACATAGACGAAVPVLLVPHGGTSLRIGALPYA